LRYRIAFFANDAATMDRLTRETPADDLPLLHAREEFAFFRGDFGQLRSLNETLVKQDLRSNERENAINDLSWLSGLESYAGNYPLARKLCAQAEAMGNDTALGLMKCAKALADAGDVTQAEALAAKLDRLFPENTLNQKIYLPVIRSIIERKRGNTAKAADLLAPVTQFPNGLIFLHRAQAYAAAGEYGKAVDDFGTVIAHRGWPEWALFAPPAQLGLARVYAMQGNLENSRTAYNEFFTTWKGADPDIPILREAKAEYRKLPQTAPTAGSEPVNKH
jgi:tetratricopeptide (TPR) repeat protein